MRWIYSSLNSSSNTVTITTFGPLGTKVSPSPVDDDEDENETILVKKKKSAIKIHPNTAAAFICWRRTADVEDARPYSSGCDDLRGGRANCILGSSSCPQRGTAGRQQNQAPLCLVVGICNSPEINIRRAVEFRTARSRQINGLEQ